MKRTFLFLLILLYSTTLAQEPDSAKTARMQWFEDAKLGIFLHWGIYAVNGTTESWGFYYNRISYEDYMKQLEGFTASKYDPEAWARLFKESGARYAVLTTKHHDGVALWDTKQNDLSVVKKSPAARPDCPLLRRAAQGRAEGGLVLLASGLAHPDYSHLDMRDGATTSGKTRCAGDGS